MERNTITRFTLALGILTISGFVFWVGYTSFNAGAPQKEWLPELIYSVLYPLAYFVPAVGNWREGNHRDGHRFSQWDWATVGVFALWAFVGGGFLVFGYTSFIVVGSTILGLIGVAIKAIDRYASRNSTDNV